MKASQTNKKVVKQAIREGREIIRDNWIEEHHFIPTSITGNVVYGKDNGADDSWIIDNAKNSKWYFADEPKESPKVAETSSPFNNGDKMKASQTNKEVVEQAIREKRPIRWKCFTWGSCMEGDSDFYPERIVNDAIIGKEGGMKTRRFISEGIGIWYFADIPKEAPKLDLSLKNALTKVPQKLYEVEIMPNSSLSGTLNVRQFIYVLTDTYLSALQKCEKFIPEKAIVTVSEAEHFIMEDK